MNFLVYAVILLVGPIILITLISFLKPRIKKSSNIYLYAFSAGMLILIGTVGFMGEAYQKVESFVHNPSTGLDSFVHQNPNWGGQLIAAGVVGGGALIGLSVIFIVRYFFVRFFGETHSDHHEHDHHDQMINMTDVDNPKSAWLAILLLLSHRTIDGFVLGSTISKLARGESLNVGLIVTFNLHIVIEILIIYYRQIQYGQTIKKAVIYNLLTTFLLLPIMLVGAFLHQYIESVGLLLPIINAGGGAVLTFVAVIELVPEFIHLRKGSKRHWYITLAAFALGIIFALVLLSFHSHAEHVNWNNGSIFDATIPV
ncbi:hypothetical protein [Candidatus Mycoplasma pogonae]